jgi:two-component system cell cycle sensor histidine kinase/response regulator CckA
VSHDQRLRTVRVPEQMEPLFLRAQEYVSRYFSDRVHDPEHGTFSISGERYIQMRAAAMSVEFFDLVMSLYQDQGEDQARSVAKNLLFDIAHSIGRADARAYERNMGVTDPIEKLSAGPIHFSYSGWAFVDILPESRPAPDESYFLVYDHPYSFESDSWLRKGRTSPVPVCIMNAGYSSGWCEESFGLPLVAAEVECLAAGGQRCRFIMAPPSRIEEHLRERSRGGQQDAVPVGSGAARVSVPEFFQRKRMEDELRQSHETLERRVQERTAELVAANEQLRREVAERRRAEEARDHFLSVAAHELKTPLTSLRGFTQLLLRLTETRGPVDPRRLRQALSTIEQQSVKLSRLVSQLLDVSRLEAGRLVLEKRPTDVVQLCATAVEAARATSDRHRIELRAAGPTLVAADSLRLEQVLTNLLDNAVKFSPQGGQVEVAVVAQGPDVVIAVTDEGPGIPPEHRARIFERFYQAHVDKVGGMGLGLHISREIVDLHGGRMWVEDGPRRGARLVVLLPAGGPG